MKKSRIFITMLLVISLLSACGSPQQAPQQPSEPSQTTQEPSGQSAQSQTPAEPSKPSEPSQEPQQAPEAKPSYEPQPLLKWAYRNPLTIDYHEDEDQDYASEYATGKTINYFTVSGLKDEAVENAINGELIGLRNRADRWEIPPFRGTGSLDPSMFEGGYKYFSMDQMWNCNDYLSVMCTTSINRSDGDYGSYGDLYCVNYDLRTGKKLALKDIFAEGYPYMDVINKRVVEYLKEQHADDETRVPNEYGFYDDGYSDTQVSLTAPFPGIREDQGFLFGDYGLRIVLDYNDDYLDFDGYYVEPFTVSISYSDFGDGLLLSRDPDPSIYKRTERPVKFLVGDLGGKVIYENTDLYKGEYNIVCEERLSYPELLDETLKADFMKKVAANRPRLAPYIRACEEAKDPSEVYYYLDCSGYCHIVGDYTVMNLYTSEPPIVDSGEYVGSDISYVYDKDGNLLTAGDMFQSGFDWQSFLEDRFMAALDEQQEYGYELVYDLDPSVLTEGATFDIMTSGISFHAGQNVKLHNREYDYDFDYDPYFYIDFTSDDALVLDY